MARKDKLNEFKKEVKSVVRKLKPESLTGPDRGPNTSDHAANAVQLVEWGQTRLAADHLLFPELNGVLAEQVGAVLRQLSYRFALGRILGRDTKEDRTEKISARFYAYEFMLELAMNYFGLESRWLDDIEKEVSLEFIEETLVSWEALEVEEHGVPIIAFAAIDSILKGMELVQGGKSMVAITAKRMRKVVKGQGPVSLEFLEAAEEEILGNVYTYLVETGRCKFGNDYALGLRIDKPLRCNLPPA